MGSELHRPLGQNMDKGRRSRGGLFRPALSVVALAVLIGFSLYTSLTPLPLSDGLGLRADADADAGDRPAPTILDRKRPENARASDPLSGQRPGSGANVVRQTMPDGNVVTTYSPKPRDGSGPVLVDSPRIGQDPRAATMPNESLIEDSAYGPLPIIGPDGLRPLEQYARPWSGARGTRIAIVIGGLGLSQTGTQNAIRKLPEEVTLAFATTGNSLRRWMQEARRNGHEILLQVPLEPFDYPANDPGRGTLVTGRDAEKNLRDLHRAMGTITNYIGIMNYMGGKFLSDADALDPVMRDIAARGLLFLDDGSSANSLTGEFASALAMPHAFGDIQIDDQIEETAILRRLDEVERIARREGSAVAIGAAFDETVQAVSTWVEEARLRGIEIVGISALAMENQP